MSDILEEIGRNNYDGKKYEILNCSGRRLRKGLIFIAPMFYITCDVSNGNDYIFYLFDFINF